MLWLIIPFMLIALFIAIGPLIFAMWKDARAAEPDDRFEREVQKDSQTLEAHGAASASLDAPPWKQDRAS